MPFVLHIIPDSVGNQKKAFVGSTKDLRGRTEYFAKRGVEIRELISEGRSDKLVLEQLKTMDLSQCTAVLFEYEIYTASLRYLKEHHPHVLRISRAHNANLPHFFDNFRGHLRMRKGRSAVDDACTALLRYRQDIECAELSDYVLSICEWERKHYWRKLTDPAKIVNVPYFLPDMYAEKIPMKKRENFCVCFMGTGGTMTPLLYDAGVNTVDFVRRLKGRFRDWKFYITGTIHPPGVLGNLGRMVPVGRTPNPLKLLARSRVMTILSDYGFGFKTKILEALMAGCWVFVTEEVYERLPECVRLGCKVIALDAVDSFSRALTESVTPPPTIAYNEQLRDEAFAALDTLFASGSAIRARTG